ncbi:MAG TPA: queuosine precursor transporter [Melioribacteraceae bacterium]|nr:queuosine precursor transporter [Melioribacteraceae bacterium]
MKGYKHLDSITAFFVAILLISNIASTKIFQVSFLSVDGGIIVFPLSYIFGDILTEVYGYNRSRKVIWLGFGSALLMSVVLIIVGMLPEAPEWGKQKAFMDILGTTPRIVLASLFAYFAGEFTNSFILAKMKVITKGKHLWARTIGSTIFGQVVDTVIFSFVAFWGLLPYQLLFEIIIANYIIKTGVEVVFTPVTYKIVSWLKREENEDYYDYNTNFNPFKLRDNN